MMKDLLNVPCGIELDCQTAFTGQPAIIWKDGKFVKIWAFGINWRISLVECAVLAKDISAVLDDEWTPPQELSRFEVEYDGDSGYVLISQDGATVALQDSRAETLAKWLEEVVA